MNNLKVYLLICLFAISHSVLVTVRCNDSQNIRGNNRKLQMNPLNILETSTEDESEIEYPIETEDEVELNENNFTQNQFIESNDVNSIPMIVDFDEYIQNFEFKPHNSTVLPVIAYEALDDKNTTYSLSLLANNGTMIKLTVTSEELEDLKSGKVLSDEKVGPQGLFGFNSVDIFQNINNWGNMGLRPPFFPPIWGINPGFFPFLGMGMGGMGMGGMGMGGMGMGGMGMGGMGMGGMGMGGMGMGGIGMGGVGMGMAR